MLEQNYAGSNKKAAANIIVVILLILIAITSLSILWKVVTKTVLLSPEDNCINYIGISLEDACYLSETELKVTLKRDFDKEEIKKIKFSFSPSDSLWEINGEKCLDVRLNKNNKYGGYCDLITAGEALSYVFNTEELELKQNQVIVSIENQISCLIGEKEIKSEC
jgi:hypothetical protein